MVRLAASHMAGMLWDTQQQSFLSASHTVYTFPWQARSLRMEVRVGERVCTTNQSVCIYI